MFNTIVVFDVYAIANDPETAIKAVLEAIAAGEKPSEQVAIESAHERNIRAAWIDGKPFVGPDISDEDFETLRGKTTSEIHAMIYTK